jgi:hypothetical protein
LGGGGVHPIDIGGVEQAADACIRQAVAFQLSAQAHGAVALGGATADQHFGEAVVVLVVLLAQTIQCLVGLLAHITLATQFLTQFAARVLAACEQTQGLVVGAGLGLFRGFIAGLALHGPRACLMTQIDQ